MRRVLFVVLFLSLYAESGAAEPTPAQIEQRLREISLEYRAMDAELKAAQLTIQNIQLRAPQLRAEEEQLKKQHLDASPKAPKPGAKTAP